MKKNLLACPALFLFSLAGLAQTAEPVKLFKDKKVKLSVDNLYKISLDEDKKTMDVIAYTNKGKAEKLVFNQDLSLKDRQDVDFDFESDSRDQVEKQYGKQARIEDGVVVLKDNLLFIGSTMLGMNIQVGEIKSGLNLGGGALTVHKGRIIRFNTAYNYGSYGSGVKTTTKFQSQQEVKLKSEESKSISYEYHKTDGEQFGFTSSTETAMTTYNKSGQTAVYDGQIGNTVYYRVYDRYTAHNRTVGNAGIRSSLIENASGDMLLVGKRKVLYKFAQKPSIEDVLPYYYIFKVSPATLEVTAQNKFQEPVSRGIIFRESLYTNGGILLISAPINVAGDNLQPKDPNVRNYVFRQIGDNTKLNWELQYEVPSGFTRFFQAIEHPDSSITLMAVTNSKKNDQYFNKPIGISGDGFFVLKIKNGKVLSSSHLSEDDFLKKQVLPAGTSSKNGYSAFDGTSIKLDQIRMLESGDAVLFATVMDYTGHKIEGRVAFHFTPAGSLAHYYYVPAQTPFQPELTPMTLRTGEKDFIWTIFDATDETGKFMNTSLFHLDLSKGTLGTPVKTGDEKHFTTAKSPFMVGNEGETLYFTGFDKSGKEFWYQKVNLE